MRPFDAQSWSTVYRQVTIYGGGIVAGISGWGERHCGSRPELASVARALGGRADGRHRRLFGSTRGPSTLPDSPSRASRVAAPGGGAGSPDVRQQGRGCSLAGPQAPLGWRFRVISAQIWPIAAVFGGPESLGKPLGHLDAPLDAGFSASSDLSGARSPISTTLASVSVISVEVAPRGSERGQSGDWAHLVSRRGAPPVARLWRGPWRPLPGRPLSVGTRHCGTVDFAGAVSLGQRAVGRTGLGSRRGWLSWFGRGEARTG